MVKKRLTYTDEKTGETLYGYSQANLDRLDKTLKFFALLLTILVLVILYILYQFKKYHILTAFINACV